MYTNNTILLKLNFLDFSAINSYKKTLLVNVNNRQL